MTEKKKKKILPQTMILNLNNKQISLTNIFNNSNGNSLKLNCPHGTGEIQIQNNSRNI